MSRIKTRSALEKRIAELEAQVAAVGAIRSRLVKAEAEIIKQEERLKTAERDITDLKRVGPASV